MGVAVKDRSTLYCISFEIHAGGQNSLNYASSVFLTHDTMLILRTMQQFDLNLANETKDLMITLQLGR